MGNGNPGLILVPGLLCDDRLWRPQLAALSGLADCRVADATRSGTMAGLARDLLEDCPFERFALAGLSMGGYVALEVVRQAPQRVVRLALLDTSARADAPEQSQRRREFIALAERGRFMGVTDALLPLLIHASRLGDAALVATVKAMAASVGKEAFVRQERAIMGRADSLPLLPQIRCPTLVLCGREDALTPLERHEEIAAAVPNARLEVIDECGHLSTLEQPDAVSAALARWLQARPGT
jgi:pimeloyl-ACP methyl ester carboxylesterase